VDPPAMLEHVIFVCPDIWQCEYFFRPTLFVGTTVVIGGRMRVKLVMIIHVRKMQTFEI